MIQKGGDCNARNFTCNIGRGRTVNNCCDGRKAADGPDCHFKDGIDLVQMDIDHQTYKDLEKSRNQRGEYRILTNRGGYRRRTNLSAANRALLDDVLRRRIKWMNDYLRPECINCDGFCINHQGRIASGIWARAHGTKKRKRRGTHTRRRTRGRTHRRGRGRTRRRGRGHGKKRRNHSRKR